MKSRLYAGLVVLAVSLTAFATTASAESTSKGKLVAFSYNADTKVGRATLLIRGDKVRFRVPRSTNCGVSYGQSGDQIPCRTLGKDKYRNRVATIKWNGKNGARVATLVSMQMY